jgi:hypothetical protein
MLKVKKIMLEIEGREGLHEYVTLQEAAKRSGYSLHTLRKDVMLKRKPNLRPVQLSERPTAEWLVDAKNLKIKKDKKNP